MRTVTLAGKTALIPDTYSSIFQNDLYVEIQGTEPDNTKDEITIQGVLYTAPWLGGRVRFYYDLDIKGITDLPGYVDYNVIYKTSTISVSQTLSLIPLNDLSLDCGGIIKFLSPSGHSFELPFLISRVSYNGGSGDTVYNRYESASKNEFVYSKKLVIPTIVYTCYSRIKPFDLDSESYDLLSVGTTPFATIAGLPVAATITGNNAVYLKDKEKEMDVTFTITLGPELYNLKNVRQW